MKIYNLKNFNPEDGDNFILGSFEAFHLGHFQLYKQIQNQPGRKIIVTFNNEKLMPKFNTKIFTDNFSKYTIFADLNFDCTVELNFNEISLMNGIDFLLELTKNKKVFIVVGKDFRFGKNAKYQAKDIANILPNAKVKLVELYKFKNVKISTKDLKDQLEFGEVEFLNLLLPYNYCFSGILDFDDEIKVIENLTILHPGVYVIFLRTEIIVYYAVLKVAFNKKITFKLIDSQINLKLKQRILIEVLTKIRLITQSINDVITEEDLKVAKSYFLNNKNLL
ncbi:FAD synthase [Mycoplasmopsis cricetuli]|uniref:FAD synthase n=1 Tax=Mycoplasmopsis cricetuli TaxID=171283 RepID=UPI00047208B7|nr:hypothetical protein [Mycoplasmopsis cricetuli]